MENRKGGGDVIHMINTTVEKSLVALYVLWRGRAKTGCPRNLWWAKWRLSTFDLYPWGEGHGVQGQICDILRPQLPMNRFLPLWPHRFPHFVKIHLGGGGVGGALIFFFICIFVNTWYVNLQNSLTMDSVNILHVIQISSRYQYNCEDVEHSTYLQVSMPTSARNPSDKICPVRGGRISVSAISLSGYPSLWRLRSC